MKGFIAVVLFATMAMPLFASNDDAVVFKAKGCARCHGEDGTQAPSVGGKPLNSHAVKAKPDAELTSSIAKGNPKLSSEEIKSLVAFIRSIE